MKTDDHILLKWGTIKGWKMEHNPECFELLKKYAELGMSMSCAAQEDTQEQKQILCDIIDKFNGTISNDWDGFDYENKDDAKKYILEYNRK